MEAGSGDTFEVKVKGFRILFSAGFGFAVSVTGGEAFARSLYKQYEPVASPQFHSVSAGAFLDTFGKGGWDQLRFGADYDFDFTGWAFRIQKRLKKYEKYARLHFNLGLEDLKEGDAPQETLQNLSDGGLGFQ